jgi:hypothetical protein
MPPRDHSAGPAEPLPPLAELPDVICPPPTPLAELLASERAFVMEHLAERRTLLGPDRLGVRPAFSEAWRPLLVTFADFVDPSGVGFVEEVDFLALPVRARHVAVPATIDGRSEHALRFTLAWQVDARVFLSPSFRVDVACNGPDSWELEVVVQGWPRHVYRGSLHTADDVVAAVRSYTEALCRQFGASRVPAPRPRH